MTGRDLVVARKGAGLSQTALADRLGVDPQSVSNWEREVKPISPVVALAIEHVTSCTAASLRPATHRSRR